MAPATGLGGAKVRPAGDAGKRLPPNEWEPGKPCSTFMRCPCGEIFNSHRLEENLIHVPHISAIEARRSYITGTPSICE